LAELSALKFRQKSLNFSANSYLRLTKNKLMKKRLLFILALGLAGSTTLFAQSTSEGLTEQAVTADAHVGTWKLVKQRVVLPDGRESHGDSTNVFQRKTLTPSHFVVTIEHVNPQTGVKLVRSAAGGRYTLTDGKYEELTDYASFPGFQDMKVQYELTVEGDTLHTIGKVNNMTYEETYIREN
jgi:hypothetical protein